MPAGSVKRWADEAGGGFLTVRPLPAQLRLRVPGVMDFRALRQEAFTATLPSPREAGATALRAHACTKTMLILSSALGAL